MPKERRSYSSSEKMAILKEHLVEGESVSTVCDKHGVRPNMFYRWQKELFDNGSVVFEHGNRRKNRHEESKVKKLESKLAQKDNVIAELMYDHVQLKKSLGEL